MNWARIRPRPLLLRIGPLACSSMTRVVFRAVVHTSSWKSHFLFLVLDLILLHKHACSRLEPCYPTISRVELNIPVPKISEYKKDIGAQSASLVTIHCSATITCCGPIQRPRPRAFLLSINSNSIWDFSTLLLNWVFPIVLICESYDFSL